MKVPVTERHWRKYNILCRQWGVRIMQDEFADLSREEMREKIRQDPHLNNVKTLRFWDIASAHLVGKPHNLNIEGLPIDIDRRASISEACSAMKHAVVVWAECEPVFVAFDDPSKKSPYPRRPEWG